MKSSSLVAIVATILLALPLGAFAASKGEKGFTLVDPVQVGSTQLKPGSYKAEWTPMGAGNNVQLNIMQHGKTLATAKAELVQRKTPAPQDEVILKTMKNNQKRLDEIDFGNKTEALVLHPAAVGKKPMSGMGQ